MLHAVDLIKQNYKLDKKFLLSLHNIIMASFEEKNPGELRNRQVYLHRKGEFSRFEGSELAYRPPQHSEVAGLLDSFFDWYNSSLLNPIEKAAVAHYKLYKIHPFLDGNKRICRLLFNKTLIDNGFPLINISSNKEEYFDALVASVETSNPKIFVDFAVKQYYSQVKDFLTSE
jgi:Fic family protein